MSKEDNSITKNIWKKLPNELIVEFCKWADPDTAIIFLFADKSLFYQELYWHGIANKLKLDTKGKSRDLCIKWLKIYRHCLQIMGGRDSVTISDWSAYFKARYNYLNIERSIQQKYPTFKVIDLIPIIQF